MSIDVAATWARALAIWTPENLAELQQRRRHRDYPRPQDLAWLRSLGVYDIPLKRPAPSLREALRQAREGAA